jgi:2'-5' RNA ligase
MSAVRRKRLHLPSATENKWTSGAKRTTLSPVPRANVGGERVRSFVALDLHTQVLVALGDLQQELAAVKADVRWVRREGLHVTLKFLGSVETERLEQVHGTLGAAVASRPALQARVRGLGAFPSLRRPRVLWAGLSAPGLVELAACVDAVLTPLGFASEPRPFTPHVTLGRVNSRRGWPQLEEILKAHVDDDFGHSAIDAVTIYRSTLQPKGALYTPLWTIPLSGNKQGIR